MTASRSDAQIERLPGLSQLEPMPEMAPPQGIEPVPTTDYFDLDAWLATNAGPTCAMECWDWQLLPSGIIYKAYLADMKESRIGTQIFTEDDDGSLWDSTLGGRAGILRYGSVDGAWPHGWQVDIEGSGQVRLDPEDERDLRSADFRFGVPLTYGYGRHRMRLAYYHISSHTGDEYQVKHPEYERLNWVRDAIALGYSYYWTDNLRLYAETSYAFYADVAKEWDIRFGFDYAPARPTGVRGAPFVAMNGHLREELNYSGNFVLQAGWAWRGDRTSHLLRTGLHYYNGYSNQYSFYNVFEQQIGAGVWYDF